MGMHEETWFTYAIVCDHCGFQGPWVVNKQNEAEGWALKFGFTRLSFTKGSSIYYHWFCPSCSKFVPFTTENSTGYDGRYWHFFPDD